MRIDQTRLYFANGVLLIGIRAQDALTNAAHSRFHVEFFFVISDVKINCSLSSGKSRVNVYSAIPATQNSEDLQLKIRAHEPAEVLRLQPPFQFIPMVRRKFLIPLFHPTTNLHRLWSSATGQEIESCFTFRYRSLPLYDLTKELFVHRFRLQLESTRICSGTRVFS